MNDLAVIPHRPAWQVKLRALDDVILDLQDGAPAGRLLDAAVMTALGWQVSPPGRRGGWMMQSPFAPRRRALPRLSTDRGATRLLRLRGWDFASGERGGRGTAWCSNGAPLVEGAGAVWFEAVAATEALALLRVLLHAYRAVARDGHFCLVNGAWPPAEGA